MNLFDIPGCRVHDVLCLMLLMPGHLINFIAPENEFRHGGQITANPVFDNLDLATGTLLFVSGDIGHIEWPAAVDVIDYFI